MKGYKVFNEDWTCRDFKYKVGGIYEIDEKPICCKRGFHFCKKLVDCFNYYKFNPKNKVAIVNALGAIDVEDEDDSKCCTNKIEIVKELSWDEVLDLVNTGYRNTGDYNTGDCNSGDYNTGDYNTGNCNTGYRNTGYRNTGYRNTGYRNTGNCNTGDCNTGDCNTGNCNTGDCNTGDCNTGDYNTGNYNTGCFNTKSNKIFMFNKISNITYEDWAYSEGREVLNEMPKNKLIWKSEMEMTTQEKEEHPEYKVTRGYLKEIKATDEDKQNWYDNLSEENKHAILSIPNFDKDIFKEITGIDVYKK